MSDTLKLAAGLTYSFDTVVIAGGGKSDSALWLKKMTARQIILLEPDPKAYLKFEKQITSLGLNNVQLQQKALIPQNQNEVGFFTASASEFSSVSQPQQIKRLRPGVTFEPKKVDSVGLVELITELKLDLSKANLLVLSVNGPEAKLIKQLNNNIFSCLIVRTSNQLLYGETNNLSVLHTYYSEQNIPLVTLPESLPPYVNLVTVRAANWHETEQKLKQQQNVQHLVSQLNAAQAANKVFQTKETALATSLKTAKATKEAQQQEIQQLTSQLKTNNENFNTENNQLKGQIEKLNADSVPLKALTEKFNTENSQLKGQIEKLNADSVPLIAQTEKLNTENGQFKGQIEKLNADSVPLKARTEKLNNENGQLKSQIEKLNADSVPLKAQTEKLNNENQQLKGQIEKLNADSVPLKEQTEKLNTENRQLRGQIEKLNADSAPLKEQTEELDNENRQLKSQIEKLNKELENSNQKLVERQRYSDLALKLQMKSQIDLDDLREKYQTKHHNEKKLVELLKELRQKLQQASEFYNHLQKNHPELTELEVPNNIPLVDTKAQIEGKISQGVKVPSSKVNRAKSGDKL
jgi:FkbM family methyltransferase